MGLIRVDVVLARAEQQSRVLVEIEEGATLEDAIRRSGLPLENDAVSVGVFGRLRALSELVADGDRIEIYRKLVADPKAARRRRAAQGLRDGARRG